MVSDEVLGRVEGHGDDYLLFWCPGCECVHQTKGWNFNGDFVKPTLTPSILVNPGKAHEVPLCHSFVTDGQIRFLADCTHALAGQTIDMVPWETAGY